MRKLLYVSFENSENRASGVNKKINGQIKAFEEEGFSTDLIAHYQSNIAFHHGDFEAQVIESNTPWRIALCGWAAKHAADYNVAYIRFQFFCPFVLNMVRSFHKAGVKTIMEIPTYPYVPELKKQGIKGIPKLVIDGSFRKLCTRYIDRFAAPLYGDPIMGKTCIEIRNGIDLNQVQPRIPNVQDNRIHILAVAMMAPWQGYDRLIEGMYRYYERGGMREVILHLVGEGIALSEYEELVNKYTLESHVLFHGKMYGEELNRMYDAASIGIGTLGCHRKNITKTNTLKVMEYLAKGLPVVCARSELGIPTDSIYRLSVEDNDAPIDIEAITQFYDSVYDCKDVNVVIAKIREECRKNCDIKEGLRDVLSFIEQ